MDHTKEESIARAFKLAFDAISMYSATHPIFATRITQFKERCTLFFADCDTLVITFLPTGLKINEIELQESAAHPELCEHFHKRNIKNIAIQRDVTDEELQTVLRESAHSLEDLKVNGGLVTSIERANLTHISVEPLNVSEALSNQGDESDAALDYIFSHAKRNKSKEAVSTCADYIMSVLKDNSLVTLLKRQDLLPKMTEFMNLANTISPEKYHEVTQHFCSTLIKEKAPLTAEQINHVAELFAQFGDDDIAQSLLNELAASEYVDTLNLEVLQNVLGGSRQAPVNRALLKSLDNNRKTLQDSHVRSKVRELFMASEDTRIMPQYQKLLDMIGEDSVSEPVYSFDQNHLKRNYVYCLLAMIREEHAAVMFGMLAKRLSDALSVFIENNDMEMLQDVLTVIHERASDGGAVAEQLHDIAQPIYCVLEKEIVYGMLPEDAATRILPWIRQGSISANEYETQLLQQTNVPVSKLALFYQLYPQQVGAFCEKIKEHMAHVALLQQIVEASSRIDCQASVVVLMTVYAIANSFIRQKVLHAMSRLNSYDKDFVLALMQHPNKEIRLEALRMAQKHKTYLREALRMSFNIISFLGWKNEYLIDNLTIIDSLGISEALPIVEELSRKPFIWNYRVRKKARTVLGSLNHE